MNCLPRLVRRFAPRFYNRTITSGASPAVNIKDARPFEEIPGPKGRYNIPLIGPMFYFKPFTDETVDEFHKVVDKILDKYGSLVRIHLGEWSVWVADPVDMETVFRNEGKYPRRQSLFLNLLFSEKMGVPNAIGDMQGEEWHQYRSPLNSLMMRTNSARHYLPVQNAVADDLVENLKKPLSKKDLADLFYRYACESVSIVCFDNRLGYLDLDIENHPEKLQTLNDIACLLEDFSASMRIPPFVLRYFPLKLKKRFFERGLRIYGQANEYYENAVEQIEKQEDLGKLDMTKHNFMTSMMSSNKLNLEQMSSIAFSLFMAGTDSTARTLQMNLYQLARNPDKQEKLYDEILKTTGSSGPITEQALSSAMYLSACVKESFRIVYPIQTGTQRYLPTDIVLKGYRIPAGTSINFMNPRAAKDPKYFPNPDSFIPERWLRDEDGRRTNEIPAAAVLPFGFGKRMCLGKRFAEQEIFLAVSKIIQNFKVSLFDDQKDLKVSYSPFAGPKEPIEFIFKEREHKNWG